MPRALIADPRPDWAKPETASVTDSAATRALRWAAWATGADKPESQITALAAPLETGPVGGLVGQIRKFIRAYHGSPHDFDQFDISKIGTGEGAQSYGHGLYFAENPKTAENYRDALARTDVRVGGQSRPVPTWSGDSSMSAEDRLIRHIADQRALNTAATDAEVVAKVRNRLEQQTTPRGFPNPYWPSDSDIAHARTQLKLLDEYAQQGITSKHGHMYEVNLHVDPDRLLDWDRPLDTQPHVEDVLRAHGFRDAPYPYTNQIMGDRDRTMISRSIQGGEDAYRVLARQLAQPREFSSGATRWGARVPSEARASAALRDAGVPGIRYLDQGSRAAGEGTRNITLFDDSPIEILRKWGLVPVAPAAAAQLGNTPQRRAASDLPPLPPSPPRTFPAPAPVTAGADSPNRTTAMPQPQPDETMRAQLPVGPNTASRPRPIVRLIDGVPHEFDPKQADGPTGGWIPQATMPTSATVDPKQPAFPTLSGPPKTVISRTPLSNAEDLATLKTFLTAIGATAGSAVLAPEAGATWLTRAALGLTGAATGGGLFRSGADVPAQVFDIATGRPTSPDNDMGRDFLKGAEGGAGLEATSLAAGPALKLAAGGARWIGKLGGDVMPSWARQIPGADKWWRPATTVARYFAGKTAGLPAVADVAASTIPPAATWAAPRLAQAGEVVGSRTLGERASGALEWLQGKLPGIVKADAPGAAAIAEAESPAVAASRARWEARQGAPARQATEQSLGRTRVIEPDPIDPAPRPDDLSRRDFFRDPDLPTQGQDWIERPPTPTNPPAAAAAPPAAPAAPAAPRPVGRSDQQWRQFQQPPRVTPAGNIPIGTPAADPGIELNLSGPNILPPTAADLAAPAGAATPATDVLQQQASGRAPGEMWAGDNPAKTVADRATLEKFGWGVPEHAIDLAEAERQGYRVIRDEAGNVIGLAPPTVPRAGDPLPPPTVSAGPRATATETLTQRAATPPPPPPPPGDLTSRIAQLPEGVDPGMAQRAAEMSDENLAYARQNNRDPQMRQVFENEAAHRAGTSVEFDPQAVADVGPRTADFMNDEIPTPGRAQSVRPDRVTPSNVIDVGATPPATATERLTQQARGTRAPMTAQQLEDAHAQMTRANAAAREAEAATAGPLEGTPNTRTLPTGDVIPWDDAAAEADAADFDPVAAFNERFGTGVEQARKATAQERRMSALTNKAIRPDLLPESSGLRDAGDLSFDPTTGEIGKWADVPETATDRLVRAIQRQK